MIESHAINIGAGVMLQVAKVYWGERRSVAERMEDHQALVEQKNLSAHIDKKSGLPVLFGNRTVSNTLQQYWSSSFFFNGEQASDCRYIVVEINHSQHVNGIPAKTVLSICLVDEFRNGRGQGRSLDLMEFPGDVPSETLMKSTAQVLDNLSAGRYDLTSQWEINEKQRAWVDGIIDAELPESCTQVEYETFCDDHGINKMTPDDILAFADRYSATAAGNVSPEQGLMVSATYRRAGSIRKSAATVFNQIKEPVSRGEYERLLTLVGIEPLTDEQCRDRWANQFCFINRSSIQGTTICTRSIHALRGLCVKEEQEASESLPVSKAGQLWEPCEQCGQEPSYLPLHVCDNCWPKK